MGGAVDAADSQSLLSLGEVTAGVVVVGVTVFLRRTGTGSQIDKSLPQDRSKLVRAMVAQLIERLRSSDQLLFQMFDAEESQPVSTAPSGTPGVSQWYSRIYNPLLGSEGGKL